MVPVRILLLACLVVFQWAILEAGGTPAREVLGFAILLYTGVIVWLLLSGLRARQPLATIGWLVLVASHFIWFAYPAASQVLAPGVWFGEPIKMRLSDAAVARAAILVSLFLLGNCIGYEFIKRRARAQAVAGTSWTFLIAHRHQLKIAGIAFLIGFSPYILLGDGLADIVGGLLAGRAEKAWGLNPEGGYAGSALRPFLGSARGILVTSGVLAGWFALLSRGPWTIRRMTCLGIFLLSALLVYFDQGTRSIFAMVVVPVLLLFVLQRAQSGNDLSRKKLVVMMLLLALVLGMATQVQLLYRYERTRGQITEGAVTDLLLPRTDFFTETTVAVMVYDRLPSQLNESALWFFVVNPIPRILWPDKPVSETMWHYSLYRWGVDIWVRGGNALPSIVGQSYINWGVPGVLWGGIFFGLVAAWFERIYSRERHHIEYFGLSLLAFTYLFLSFRFLAPGFHYPVLFAAAVLYWYYRSAKRRARARMAPPPALFRRSASVSP